jgi:PAS domain S-box-containing protein
MADDSEPEKIGQLLGTPGLADALESDRFKQFLDHVPVAIAVSELQPSESITYANIEFERLTGQTAAAVEGRSWRALPGVAAAADDDRRLSEAVRTDEDYLGCFAIDGPDGRVEIDAWSNTIEDDSGSPMFRLVALAAVGQPRAEAQAQALHDKDVLLRELQHRVKNNLQMVTALIRMEARNVRDDETGKRFDRLAGRIGALSLLYDTMSTEGLEGTIDLGVYLSQIASAVMQAHATEGIRLDLLVDTWPVSINVAMPAGLVVNELLTNALKHAFVGRDGGTIRLHSLIDDSGCRVTISDDGIGLPEGTNWPKSGKLGAVIVQSLKQNARAQVTVESVAGQGMTVAIFFAREAAAPAAG